MSSPRTIVRLAAERGLSHLAITDHERLDGALRARDLAPPELTIIVGEEIRTTDGDMLGLYLMAPVAPGMSAHETALAIHAQGGLVGLPHPFDRFRGSAGAVTADAALGRLAAQLDFVEAFNARVPFGSANQRAADFASRHELPGVASSDAHSLFEVGIAYSVLAGAITDAASLRAALERGPQLVMGRASLVARGLAPGVKLIQRMRGNHRIRPPDPGRPPVTADATRDR